MYFPDSYQPTGTPPDHSGTKDTKAGLKFLLDPTTTPPTVIVVGTWGGPNDQEAGWFTNRRYPISNINLGPFTNDEFRRLLRLRSRVIDRVGIENGVPARERGYERGAWEEYYGIGH